MKKVAGYVFIALFLVILILPAIYMDTRTQQISENDNEYLPEIKLRPFAENNLSNYLSKRIGFRSEMLTAYQLLNDSAFSIMVHPLYMYGQEGWVYFKSDGIISLHQHIGYTSDYAVTYANSITILHDEATRRSSKFIFFLVPDKETLYPEYYRKGINVLDVPSLAELCLTNLEVREVPCYYSYQDMIDAKKKMLVNNPKYDAGHWNDNGALVSLRGLYKKIACWFPNFVTLQESDYILSTTHQSTLPTSHYPINEDVPLILVANDSAEKTDSTRYNDNDCVCYLNPGAHNDVKVMVVMDSYLRNNAKFLTPYFSEVVMIHRQYINADLPRYTALLDAFRPDLVIFETPERCLQTAGFTY